MKMRRLGAVASSLLAAAALTACGSGSGSSAGATFTPLTLADFGTSVATPVKHVRTVHMTITSSVLTANADFNYGPPLAMQMSMQISTGGQTVTMQMRLLGSVMYMQIPGRTPAGKFMSMDLAKYPATSSLFKLLAQMQHYGPSSLMSQFKEGVKSVQYIGEEEIDGQSARHYAVTVDPAVIVKLLNNPAVSAYASQLKDITEQVYLDANRRPLRIVTSLPAPAGSTQIDFGNWGQPVQVIAPPASQVMQVPTGTFG